MNEVNAANPSLVQLADGTVLLAYNSRPPQAASAAKRFSIELLASTDNGRTWERRADGVSCGSA